MTDNGSENSDSPVLPELTSLMKVDVMVAKSGELWVFHDTPINEMAWVEYDDEEATLTLVTETGQLQEIGMKHSPLMQKCLQKSHSANLAYVADKKIQGWDDVPVTKRQN